MRFSQIIGEAFYGIQLSNERLQALDAHFLAASHHRVRSFQADTSELVGFHQTLYWKHLRELMQIVMNGDFSEARDLSGRNLHRPEAWNPDKRFHPEMFRKLPENPSALDHLLPTPEMFEQFDSELAADRRYPLGDHHPYDALLASRHIHPAQINLEACFA